MNDVINIEGYETSAVKYFHKISSHTYTHTHTHVFLFLFLKPVLII